MQGRESRQSLPVEVPLLGATENAHGVVQNGSLVLAWSNDSLRIVNISPDGAVRELATVGALGAPRATRVMQLTANKDSVYVLLSDRRTELVIATTGGVHRRDIEYPRVPSLDATHSAIGLTPNRRVLRIPILLPDADGQESKGPILATDSSDIRILDTTSLGRRVVGIQMRQGPSLIYESPLRGLYDLGTRLAISGDGSMLAAVDTRTQRASLDLDARLIPVDHMSSSSRARWSARLPLVLITQEEWRQARDSSVRLLELQFESADDARARLGALAQPGGVLPAVRAVRASPTGIVVELHERYAERAGFERLVLLTSSGTCQIRVAANEHAVSVGSSAVWTLERRGAKTYARSRPLCEPRR